MTSKLVGVFFHSNLLPGRVVDASTSITVRHPRNTRRLEGRTDADGAVWGTRRAAEDESVGYADPSLKQLSSGDAVAYRPGFMPSAEDAAAVYDFYARMLAGSWYPTLNVYA